MAGQDKLRRNELMILQKEATAITQMIEKYQNTLNRLQVEELTLRSQLGRIQDVELKSRTTTPLESILVTSDQVENCQLVLENSSKILGHEITMNELQINQSTLNLDAAPLIQRMLQDSQAYEEEEEDDPDVA